MEPLLSGKGLDFKLQYMVFKVYLFYYKHFQGMTDGNKIYLLTDNKKAYLSLFEQIKESAKLSPDMAISIIDQHDYISMNQDKYPELSNFMGFQNEDDEMEDLSSDKSLFYEHLSFD